MTEIVTAADLAPGDVIADPSIVFGGTIRVDDVARDERRVTLLCRRPGRRQIVMLDTDRVTLIRRGSE